MTPEERTVLFTEIIASAREGKKYAAFGTVQRRELSRIIRLTKRLYIDLSKEADAKESV